MLQFDLLGLIPPSLKRQALDALVDFVSEQARKFASDEVAARINKLRSDAAFQSAFEAGLERATRRFIEEYELEDEDLVAAIAADKDFFKNKEVRSALLAILEQPGVHLTDERATVAQSFATVLPHRKNRERVDRAVTYLLKCLAEELWHLPELRPIYSLQFQRMAAEAARQQVELQKAQLQALTGLSAGVREALLQLTDAIVERKLLPSGDTPALSAPPQVYHNLPQPDYGTFIGRDEELKQVHWLLSPKSRHFLVTIDGIGGIGKSALALEVAHRYLRDYDRLPEEERFEAIIWTSAKSAVLTADGITPRQQITRTLEDIYITISVTLEREDITRARPEEQDELVAKALTQQRTLLIVDNLETVDDERVNTFLRELPAPTKAIVTTRHRFDVAYPARLTGMSQEEGMALIAQECAKKNVTLTKTEVERLYNRTGGVPLAIVWSVAQMGYGYSGEAVLRRLGQPTSDIACFCFEETLACIRGKPAYKVLIVLSLFATDASREALGYVADLPALDRDDGLVELEKLSLVNRRGVRFDALPLTKLYSVQEAMTVSGLVGEAMLRLRDYFVSLIQEKGGTNFWDTSTNWRYFAQVGGDLENILSVLDWTWKQEDWANVLALAKGIIHLLHARGRWEERIICAKQALQAAKQLGKPDELVWFYLSGLGYVELQRGEYKEARQSFSTGLKIAKSTENLTGVALAESMLALLGIAMQDYEEARPRITAALSIIDQTEGLVKANIHKVAGHWFRLQQQYTQAEKHYGEALRINQDIGLGAESSQYGWLGHIRFNLGQYEIAKEAFERCLDLARETQNTLGIANAQYGLALIAESEGKINKAKTIVRDAIAIFSQYGAKSELEQAELLLNRL